MEAPWAQLIQSLPCPAWALGTVIHTHEHILLTPFTCVCLPGSSSRTGTRCTASRSVAPTPRIGPKYQASHGWMNEWVNPRYHQFQGFHVTIETLPFPLTSLGVPKTISPIEVRGWPPHLSRLILSHPKPRNSKPILGVLTLSPRVNSDFRANSNSLEQAGTWSVGPLHSVETDSSQEVPARSPVGSQQCFWSSIAC